jgi:aspartyl-tRNA(Asn)/glutamyl-tRNA(Gln) amidotransferase subunit B
MASHFDERQMFVAAFALERALGANGLTMSSDARANEDRYEMVVGLEGPRPAQDEHEDLLRLLDGFRRAAEREHLSGLPRLARRAAGAQRHAVELASRAALALGCTCSRRPSFARKNYFYPDLPKGYQISQFDKPLATDGRVTIGSGDGAPIDVGVTRVHMEEDAGKSIHDRFPGATAIDLNRAGVPLVEIVSEPDMRRAARRRLSASAQADPRVRRVSDVSMEEGSLRVDANVSARARRDEARHEDRVKNMNSFSGVERALEVEFARQCASSSAAAVEQQTMLWDAAGEVRRARRRREPRLSLFPEPDLPPLVFRSTGSIASSATARAARARARAIREGVSVARRLRRRRPHGEPAIGDYFEQSRARSGDAKDAANWVMGEVLAPLKRPGRRSSTSPCARGSRDLLDIVARARQPHRGKQVFATMVETGDRPRRSPSGGLLQGQRRHALARWVDEVLAEHPDEARRFLGGEKRCRACSSAS